MMRFVNILFLLTLTITAQAQPVKEVTTAFVVYDANGKALDFITQMKDEQRIYKTRDGNYLLEAFYIDPHARKPYSIGTDMFCSEGDVTNKVSWQSTSVTALSLRLKHGKEQLVVDLIDLPIELGRTIVIDLPAFKQKHYHVNLSSDAINTTVESQNLIIRISDWEQFQIETTN
jgi:hypothetical protein